MKPFDYIEPTTIDEALDLLDRFGGEAKVLAGGTDLIVQMKQGKIHPQMVVSLNRIKALDFVEWTSEEKGSRLRLGPTTPLSSIAHLPLFRGHLSILREAALAVGDVQIRNQATLGGNVANGSPSADMVPPLLALGAKVIVRKKDGKRRMDLEGFFRGPFMTQLAAEELIVEILIDPIPEGNGTYLWVPKRTAVDETLVGVGAWITCDVEKKFCLKASLVLSSVGPGPIRATGAETFLQGKSLGQDEFREAGEIAAQEVSPRSRAEYRRRIVSVLVEEAVEKAWRRAVG